MGPPLRYGPSSAATRRPTGVRAPLPAAMGAPRPPIIKIRRGLFEFIETEYGKRKRAYAGRSAFGEF